MNEPLRLSTSNRVNMASPKLSKLKSRGFAQTNQHLVKWSQSVCTKPRCVSIDRDMSFLYSSFRSEETKIFWKKMPVQFFFQSRCFGNIFRNVNGVKSFRTPHFDLTEKSLHFPSFPAYSWTPKAANTNINPALMKVNVITDCSFATSKSTQA